MAFFTFQFKRGSKQAWEEKNILLKAGEPGFEKDTGRLKIGNGINPWNELPYVDSESALSPDGNSLAVTGADGKLTIYGFEDAQPNQIAMKTVDGKIAWVTLADVAFSGDIADLVQSKPVTLYGGSAIDNVEVQ